MSSEAGRQWRRGKDGGHLGKQESDASELSHSQTQQSVASPSVGEHQDHVSVSLIRKWKF